MRIWEECSGSHVTITSQNSYSIPARYKQGAISVYHQCLLLYNHAQLNCNVLFGLPKRSNYKSIIDEQLLKYREQGLIETLWKKWSNQPAACSDTQSGDDRLQMGLVRLSGLFYILLAGVAASVCILVLEFVAAAWVDSTRGEDISVWGALKKRIILLKHAKIGKSEENKKKDDRVAYDWFPD